MAASLQRVEVDSFEPDLLFEALAGKVAVVGRIEKFLSQQPAQAFQLAGLVDATGIHERSLEALIQDVYGVSPRELSLISRLNHIRRDLQKSHPGEQSVAAVAKRWGIRHVGRFAGQYTRLFGERPYETLIRGR